MSGTRTNTHIGFEQRIGADLVTNSEFTTDLTGWTSTTYTQTRVDSGVDPGASSGGEDDWCLKGVATIDVGRAHVYNTSSVIGNLYKISLRYYIPTGDPSLYVTFGSLNNISAGLTVDTKDAWTPITVYVVAANTNAALLLGNFSSGGAIGDILYIDDVSIQVVNLF